MSRTVGLVHVPDRPCGEDPDLWYAMGPLRKARAKAICQDCPFRVRCLWTALVADERAGIWGGLEPDERRALREQLQSRDRGTAIDFHTVAGDPVRVEVAS